MAVVAVAHGGSVPVFSITEEIHSVDVDSGIVSDLSASSAAVSCVLEFN